MTYRERVLAAMVLVLWGAYLAGRALLAAHAFRWWVVLPLAAVAAFVVERRRRKPLPMPPVSRPFVVVLGVVGALVLLRVLKGAASPPLGWDGLTYHLFKSGRFASLGRPVFETAPDGWGYYESFPAAGSVLHGLGMLVARDGALVPWIGGAFGLFAAFAVYVLARRLGGTRVPAAFAAGTGRLGKSVEDLPLLDAGQCNLAEVDQALDRLALASPAIKRQVLEACVETVSVDGQLNLREAELLRAIADTLDCPLPPVLNAA